MGLSFFKTGRPRYRAEKREFPGLRPDPLALWKAAGSPWRFWLDSGPGFRSGRFTYLAWGGPLWAFRGKNGRGEILRPGRPSERFSFTDPAVVLKDLLGDVSSDKSPGAFPGGAVGYWGYECARYFDPAMGPATASRGNALRGVPDFLWVLPAFWAVMDRDGGLALIRQSGGEGTPASRDWTRWEDRLKNLPSRGAFPPPLPFSPPREETLEANRSAYEAGVRRIRRYIAAGDVYQANLSHRLDFPWPRRADPADFFAALRRLNPSPYGTLLDFPGFSLAGCSPELLLRVRGDRVETRPIAGTRPRGDSDAADRALSGELLLNPKERAEHIMLVDLERNDLGRVCRPGTVRVTERMSLEKYSHVIHIVSQVEGRLQKGRDGFDAVRALFPGGTITGCPKIRCMEILNALEKEPRGPFYGSAGWVSPSGDMDLNILIRTALIAGGRLILRVGAGIVADSLPEKEHEETLHKARALLAAYRRMASAAGGPERPRLGRPFRRLPGARRGFGARPRESVAP